MSAQMLGLIVLQAELAHRNWTEHPTVLEFEERTEFGRRPFRGPLLIMFGDLDAITDIDSLKETIASTCKALESSDSQEICTSLSISGSITFPSFRPARASGLVGLGTDSSYLEVGTLDAARKLLRASGGRKPSIHDFPSF